MSLGFRKFISEMFMNGKFPKILPSENFPLYGKFYSSYMATVAIIVNGRGLGIDTNPIRVS